jgi:hypothetical protein
MGTGSLSNMRGEAVCHVGSLSPQRLTFRTILVVLLPSKSVRNCPNIIHIKASALQDTTTIDGRSNINYPSIATPPRYYPAFPLGHTVSGTVFELYL